MCLERKDFWLHLKYCALPNTAICKNPIFFVFKIDIWIIECLDMPNIIWITENMDYEGLKNRVSTIPMFV